MEDIGGNRPRRAERHGGLLGKRVIVDVTYTNGTEQTSRRQFCGVIARVTQHNVWLRLSCGRTIDLPPDPSLYAPAPPGPHRLFPTGEAVTGVDLVIAFSAAGPYAGGVLHLVRDPQPQP